MTLLKALWAWWKAVAHRLGTFQARVILSAFYFVVLAPFALGMKVAADPFRGRPPGASAWLPRLTRTDEDAVSHGRRQF
jgi:hypothetical protein